MAGRSAYLAGFHAAQALIFEQLNRAMKTQNGVQGETWRLIKDGSNFDSDLRDFLSRRYNLKQIADYEVGPTAKVSDIEAAEAIEEARRFVAAIENPIGS